MTIVIIVVLAGVAIYLGGAWLTSRNEVSQLRVHIASLKRQLARNQTLN